MISKPNRVRAILRFAVLPAGFLALLPAASAAQGSGQGFLFKRPGIQVGFHAGYTRANAGGAVLDRALADFTLNKRDFDASTFGLEFAFRARERLDVSVDARFLNSTAGSESRPYVGADGLPILQTTTLRRIPLTVSAKYYLRDRGRSVSQFAWIPRGWAPFVGVGGGLIWYTFKQQGEFVEEPSLDILNLTLKSSGAASTGHVFAGVDVSISPRFLWTVEGRYSFSSTETGAAFDFGDIDLSGFQATIGLAARF